MVVLKYNDPVDGWKPVPTVTGQPGPQGDPASNVVTSVNGDQGAVVLTRADFPDPNGLDHVDNKSDEDKPISVAQQSALNEKKSISGQITRTMSYSNGGLGNTVTASQTSYLIFGSNISLRIPLRLPVNTTKWRFRFRNWNGRGVGVPGGVDGYVLKKIIFGENVQNTTGSAGESGDFAPAPIGSGTATTIVGTDTPIPRSFDWFVTPWVTAPGDQFKSDKAHLLGLAYTSPIDESPLSGTGFCRAWDGTGFLGVDPTSPSTGSFGLYYLPFDWVIDYEVTSDQQAWLFVGDSITEGISGTPLGAVAPPNGIVGTFPSALWRTAPAIWARKNNILVANMSLAGAVFTNFTNPKHELWKRFDHMNAKYDGAVLGLGSNDIDNGGLLPALQTNFCTVAANIRAVIGEGKPIYAMNILSRGSGAAAFTSAKDQIRLDFNSWLTQRPAGIAGVIDADAKTRGGIVKPCTLFPAYTSDGTHLSFAGLAALASAYQETIRL